MRRISNPHNRPIQFDLTLLADSRAAVALRLRKLAEQIECERMLMTPSSKGGGGGNCDDFEFQVCIK